MVSPLATRNAWRPVRDTPHFRSRPAVTTTMGSHFGDKADGFMYKSEKDLRESVKGGCFGALCCLLTACILLGTVFLTKFLCSEHGVPVQMTKMTIPDYRDYTYNSTQPSSTLPCAVSIGIFLVGFYCCAACSCLTFWYSWFTLCHCKDCLKKDVDSGTVYVRILH